MRASLALLVAVSALASLLFSAQAAEIRNFAGTGAKGFSGDGGPAAAAQIANPFGLTRAPDGSLVFCDMDNHRLRKIAADGKITTLVGSGERGWSGDGGPALQAKLNEPYEVCYNPAGDLFWCERMSHTVRRLDAKTGVVSTIAGTGKPGFGGDGGPAAQAQLNQPHSIAFDAAGRLYICDIGNHRIRVVDFPAGQISTFAGTGEKRTAPDGARFAGAPLFGPRALAFAKDGQLWLVLREGNALYRLDPKDGTLHHMAGAGGKAGFTGNGGPAKAAVLGGPKGVSIAPDGRVYIADTESHSIRYYDPSKETIELLAGTGKLGDGPEGAPAACQLARPHGILVDADGAIYIGDSEAHRIRVVR